MVHQLKRKVTCGFFLSPSQNRIKAFTKLSTAIRIKFTVLRFMSNLDSSQYALCLGRVDGKAYFDTHADGTAGTRLAAHLDAIRGQYVTQVIDY